MPQAISDIISMAAVKVFFIGIPLKGVSKDLALSDTDVIYLEHIRLAYCGTFKVGMDIYIIIY